MDTNNIIDDDPYKLLGVLKETIVTEYEIRSAYRKAALKYHPDRFHNNKKKEANEMFIKISNAYEVLLNDHKRKRNNKVQQQQHDYHNDDHRSKNNHDDDDDDRNDVFQSHHFDHDDNVFHYFNDPYDVFDSVFREEFFSSSSNSNHNLARSSRRSMFSVIDRRFLMHF